MHELEVLSGKTVIVTGADGMLGRAFVEALSGIPGLCVNALGHAQLDVTDREKVLGLVDVAPDFIVHCAADVDAERCESNPKRCWDVQVSGTGNVAELASSSGSKVLYPQSFLIFDGREVPIVEDTPPVPLSVYGRCKYEAEELLRSRVPGALVIRMGGFFGGDEKDKNFVGKFVRHLHHLIADDVRSFEVGDRVWQPTYTLDLAQNSLLLLAHSKEGIYNMACHGRASFHELAAACVEELGLGHRISIVPVSEAEVVDTERAHRPAIGVMENRRLQAEGLDRQRPWRQALAQYLSRPYFRSMFASFFSEDNS
jgi:dTDP-4-dehydrorhamnose reductase